MCNSKGPSKSILIEAGAHVNIANNEGLVPIMCFVQKGDDQIMTELIKEGADVNKKQALKSPKPKNTLDALVLRNKGRISKYAGISPGSYFSIKISF